MTLTFTNAEKHINDTLVFPSFDLSIEVGTVVAVHSNVNIREQLIDLLLGKALLSNGEIRVAGSVISDSKQKMGFLFLNSELYERLSIEETLTFFKRLYSSKEPLTKQFTLYN